MKIYKLKKARFVLCINIFIFLIYILFGCSNDLSDIVSDYNSKFTPIYPDEHEEITPIDDKFNSSALLLDQYVVSDKSTLNLCAPIDCTSYTWSIQDPESGSLKPISIKTMDGTSSTTRKLALYIPNSGLQGAKTYRLVLDVISTNNKHYVDYATLAVYKDYYFETGIVTIPPGKTAYSSTAVINSENINTSYSQISARSILPSAPSIDQSGMHYYVYAQNLLTGNAIQPFEISLTKTGDYSGTGIFYLPKGNYLLTLMGFFSEPAQTSYEYLLPQCNLIAFAAMDNRYDDSATFVLKSSVTASNLGAAELKFYTTDWTVSDPYYAGYDIETELLDLSDNVISHAKEISLKKANLPEKNEPHVLNYKIRVKAGTYRLNVHFYKGTEKYTFSDLLTISSGVTTSAEVGIPPLVSSGITNLKIFTDNWHILNSNYDGYTVSTSITNAINGTLATCQTVGDISRDSLGNTIPSSPSLIVYAEFGNYILNISFKKNNKEYKWSYPFSIEPGKEKTETEGIPSSVIPLGNNGGG